MTRRAKNLAHPRVSALKEKNKSATTSVRDLT
jgi:hypothetical protein